jgi:aspartyl-tRNA(Asn)/glutamyl-tRNA(Gln) amidotransferase subunit C
MAVDTETVRRIAKLSKLALDETREAPMVKQLNGILEWVEQLKEVDIEGVQPMTSVVAQKLKMREDVVADGNHADDLMVNAPGGDDHFFVVPKVVE